MTTDAATLKSDTDAPVLDALRFPLHGSRLIEASAGTGKTFTIAMLYVRLVLGHGDASRAYTPPEILVVTFTDAATQELRERIRRRLAEAAEYFRADPEQIVDRPPGADLLHDLRADYLSERWPGCARQLQLAAEWMDEAAVSTIHGWCYRMLREHAFDSDSLFTQTLETDHSELLAEVARDYWRIFIAGLAAEAVAAIRPWWPEPAALLKAVNGLLGHVERLKDAPIPAQSISETQSGRQQRLDELKAPWRNTDGHAIWIDELQTLLDDAVACKQVNGHKLQARYYQPWLISLRDWLDDPAATWPDLKTGWTRLTPDGLRDAWKVGAPPTHPALTAIAGLQAELNALPDARTAILSHAARWIARRFDAEQSRRAQMGFNDLLTRLDVALQGSNGKRLAASIRRQFPVALIDEFQDTDPVQYRIVDAVYQVAINDPNTALILIGDPKQAIYAFRGADIFTYLAARRDCAGRLQTLKTNYRSTASAVAAVNRWFGVAETRQQGSGAFLFRDATTNPVPFVPAQAHGHSVELQVQGQTLQGLTAWWLAVKDGAAHVGKGDYRQRIAETTASEIVRLLNLGQQGLAGFVDPSRPDQPITPLQPGQIAVLVSTGAESRIVRDALAQRCVRSVYLSDKESVFQSAQASELHYWLAACAAPDDSRLLHAALATATLGLSLAELDRYNHDELAWEARVMQFRGYRDLWRHQGVLPMLRRLLNDFEVPARLLGTAQDAHGERILTDILHLAELLQQASRLLEGEQTLIRYLAEQCEDASGAGTRQIRLESDANLVKVVTVHKSKGLQYPLVFLPFAADHRPLTDKDRPLLWHDDAGQVQLSPECDASILAQANRERLGEDLRKLYVALTRAQSATWIGLAPLDALGQGACGYLLGGGESASLEDALLSMDSADIAVIAAPQPTDVCFAESGLTPTPGAARTSRPILCAPWWIASYSVLRLHEHRDWHDANHPTETPQADQFQELETAQQLMASESFEDTASRAAPVPGSPHAFPRGADAGTFLHDLLEWSATRGFAEVAADPARLRDIVARRCQVRGWALWVEPLTEWLLRIITQPLQLPALDHAHPERAEVRLTDLSCAMPEMEFWLSAHQADIHEIDRLICTHTLNGVARPALHAGRINGLFKGFIDLVFEHAGRYYVADYKSNWLGAAATDYSDEAMRTEILSARYDLQYALYLFALHRLLRSRLPDYDYDRHVGGALYLFLRGIHAPTQGIHAERPPRQLIMALDACFAATAAQV